MQIQKIQKLFKHPCSNSKIRMQPQCSISRLKQRQRKIMITLQRENRGQRNPERFPSRNLPVALTNLLHKCSLLRILGVRGSVICVATGTLGVSLRTTPNIASQRRRLRRCTCHNWETQNILTFQPSGKTITKGG